MAIVQGDTLIKRAIELMLDEVRKNEWLIRDILSDMVDDPLLAEIYGKKEVDNAVEWFRTNKVPVLMKHRKDLQSFPCVTIAMGASGEADDLSTLADQSTDSEFLQPETIGKPIPYVIKPFQAEYLNGIIMAPEGVSFLDVAPGMLILDPATGKAYPIQELNSQGLVIQGSPVLTATTYGVIPQYRYWKARRERAIFRETYQIGVHADGDPTTLLWLHSIVLYGLLRYRESLFEARDFQLGSVSSSDFTKNGDVPAGDNVYSRWITLSGQVTNSWLKSPMRTIEKVVVQGILIDANLDTTESATQQQDDLWVTKAGVSIKKSYTRKNPK